MPGSCNDLNVLAKSPLFDELTAGRAPKIEFQVNNRVHKLGYYLADGIYPRWVTFDKTIPHPTCPKDITFFKAQNGYRNDVEMCFVEDECPADSDDDLEFDEEEENNMRPRIAEVWDGPTGRDFDEVANIVHPRNIYRAATLGVTIPGPEADAYQEPNAVGIHDVATVRDNNVKHGRVLRIRDEDLTFIDVDPNEETNDDSDDELRHRLPDINSDTEEDSSDDSDYES
ncbi:hypothetical protein ACLB2K_064735 [Fragaria x ananassa]